MIHTKYLSENPNWSLDKAIVLNVGFIPGSISLTAYRLNLQGYEWIRSNKDANPNPNSFTTSYYEKMQLLLSDRFLGYFMVPDNLMWNYNFVGLGVVNNIKYAIVPGTPKEFYHESHRPSHFLRFVRSENEENEEEKADKDDLY